MFLLNKKITGQQTFVREKSDKSAQRLQHRKPSHTSLILCYQGMSKQGSVVTFLSKNLPHFQLVKTNGMRFEYSPPLKKGNE